MADDEARRVAEGLGFPVLVKAVAGGGGRGIRAADTPDELPAAFTEAAAKQLLLSETGVCTSRSGSWAADMSRSKSWRTISVIASPWVSENVHCNDGTKGPRRVSQVPAFPVVNASTVLPVVAEAVRRSGYHQCGYR